MLPVGDGNFPKMEEKILQKWEKDDVFKKQDDKTKSSKEFSFYDGPPFANGLPHYGHLLASAIKDTVTRYWVMKGFRVNRRFGWDCHGLPVEFEIEKRENLKGRPDILKMGIDKFNETCRDSVLQYTEEWQKTIKRLGRWVNWGDQYRTMDLGFMESVWWVFSQLNNKGLIYKGFKVVPYSPRTTSVVSNFEANQNYQKTTDPSVFVKFRVKNKNFSFIAWTTTPWTLPSNLALAVGKDINYVHVIDPDSNEEWVVAKDAIYNLFDRKKSEINVLKSVKGSDLVGLEYEPIFPYFIGHKNSFKVLDGDFVTTETGTGIVHQAPAFGEDDFLNCKSNGIDLVDPVDAVGNFTEVVSDFAGMYIKDADKPICRHLKKVNLLVKQSTIEHSYPFDERTDTPLIYKAVPSWYVNVESFVDRLVKNNNEIEWVPSHLKDGRMGSWLKNARDWSISRNRFWGTPLPVWSCDQDSDHRRFFSSVSELEEASQSKIKDIHLHCIKDITFPCLKCGGVLKNENLVFDCWFESGSMPYAQLHYPQKNNERFKDIFPADFVAEGLDQTRGWFYTLNVLSTALFDRPAFKNVIVNGVILDESGKKMSKRHRNYTPPEELMNKYGADSVRLYMLSSPLLRAEDLIFSDNGVREITRKVILPLWNSCSFLSTYANADSWKAKKSLQEGEPPLVIDELDKWVISKLQTLALSVELHMKQYKLYSVVPSVLNFVDDLTNWYIRLNRKRFWGQNKSNNTSHISEDQDQAYSTLYYVLMQFSKILAPFAPFVSDHLYHVLTDGCSSAKESIHLCDEALCSEVLLNKPLEEKMELVRKIINHGRALRQKNKIKTRQALPSLTVISKSKQNELYIKESIKLIKDELNVKSIVFSKEESSFVKFSLRPNLPLLGARLGPKLKILRDEFKLINSNYTRIINLVENLEKEGKAVLESGIEVSANEVLVDREPLENNLLATEGGVTILLDTTLTSELIAEGRARELVNRIQNLRKVSGLDVSDRISLEIIVPEALVEDIKTHKDYIANETLGTQVDIIGSGSDCKSKFIDSYNIDGMTCVVGLDPD